MSNWFEENATKSIIIYTILIATSVWAFSHFILDENKIASYKAEITSYKTKIEFLEREIATLTDKNSLYISWLEEEKKSFPSLEKKIEKLGQENERLESSLAGCHKTTSTQSCILMEYVNADDQIRRGEVFIDELTEVMLGVLNIHSNYTADIMITIPNEDPKTEKNVKPSQSWSFEANSGKEYRIIITNINWYSSSLGVEVRGEKCLGFFFEGAIEIEGLEIEGLETGELLF